MQHQFVLALSLLWLMLLGSCTNQPKEADTPPITETEERETFDTIVVNINDTLSTTTIYIAYDSFYIIINKWQDNEWVEHQRLDTLTCDFTGSAPEIMDINGDGHQDIRVYKMTGARGGNQFAYVYLFDKVTQQYRFLKGSTEMPNLVYNPKKKLIEGLGYTASLSYVWFKVENDSLIEVSSLNHEVREIDGKSEFFDFYYETDDTGGHVIVKVDSFKGAAIAKMRPLDVAPRD